jgi:phosphate transport system permease protein
MSSIVMRRSPLSRGAIRKLTNYLALALSGLATIVGLFCLGAILWSLLWHGIPGLSLHVFTRLTPPPSEPGGGLLNAIFGSLVMTVLGIAVGGPIGLLAGTYLAEYGRGSRLGTVVRFVNDVLLSAPSIIIGLFIYELLVANVIHGFSALAGAMALAVIAIPVALRTSEDMLSLVPQGMKDASTAMGAYPWRTITSVIYPAARSGLVTGLLLAVARISGETAPLLFTAFNQQFWNANLLKPIASLPVTINNFANQPYASAQQLAWTGALLITLAILVLSVTARSLISGSEGGRR